MYRDDHTKREHVALANDSAATSLAIAIRSTDVGAKEIVILAMFAAAAVLAAAVVAVAEMWTAKPETSENKNCKISHRKSDRGREGGR